MKFKNPEIEKLYDYISRMSREAYKDDYLISNVVFSKQESRGHILESYLTRKLPPKITFLFAAKKLLLYLIKNIADLTLSVLTVLLHRISGQKFRVEGEDELVILDTYFAIDHIITKGNFEDIYFPGLSGYLTKKQKAYVYIPRWFGPKRLSNLLRVFKILKKNRIPVLTQFQVLNMIDYLKTLWFLICYPFSVFRFMKSLGSAYEDKVICHALWNVFDGAVVEHHMRLILGRRLSSLVAGRIKCLSWYENLVADKNFYLGLRAQPDKVEIIGVQLFVRPNTLMNIVPDKQEIPCKVVPDRILVNGPGYRFNLDGVRVDIGPALRYRHLFRFKSSERNKKIILVVLPYHVYVVNHLLNVIQEVEWPAPVVLKFHPTMDWKKYEKAISERFAVTEEDLSTLLPRALIAVGHSTGALIEAASLGIPAIDIHHPQKFSHDYMPEIGKGILWDEADNAEKVMSLIKQFQLMLQVNPEQLKEEGNKMRAFCFSEPTEELIGKAFELD